MATTPLHKHIHHDIYPDDIPTTGDVLSKFDAICERLRQDLHLKLELVKENILSHYPEYTEISLGNPRQESASISLLFVISRKETETEITSRLKREARKAELKKIAEEKQRKLEISLITKLAGKHGIKIIAGVDNV